MRRPELCEKLAILNMPHPYSLARELATNAEQVKYSQYARNFLDPEFYKQISLERLGNKPLVERKYRVLTDRSHRAIGGLSMDDYILAEKIDGDFLDGRFSSVCQVGSGQPPLPVLHGRLTCQYFCVGP